VISFLHPIWQIAWSYMILRANKRDMGEMKKYNNVGDGYY